MNVVGYKVDRGGAEKRREASFYMNVVGYKACPLTVFTVRETVLYERSGI